MEDDVVVSSVAPSRRDGSVVAVALSSGDRHLISAAQLSDLRIAPGDRLDRPQVASLEAAAGEQVVEARLLRLLAVRPRSRAELSQRLAGWEVGDQQASALLSRLVRAGLLDDAALAEQVSEGLRRREHGSLRARHDLARLGIDDGDAAGAVAGHAEADVDIAAALLERRFGGPPPYDTATTRRAAGLLARRGFSEDAIAGLLRIDVSGA
jgi:regulatory protein